MERVLITGGAGYIGSHVAAALAEEGMEPVLADNLSNASASVVARLSRLTGMQIKLFEGDVCDAAFMGEVFASGPFYAAVHCAASKAVAESVRYPLKYYKNNILSVITLCEQMSEHGVKRLVFSSSATVYGPPRFLPLTEEHPTGDCANPYGNTKCACETLLRDLCRSDGAWAVALLRYFNPIGAHPSGLIGEEPRGTPANALPLMMLAASGKLPRFTLTGADYPTPDGTGIRDYLHIQDLARGHVAALRFLGDFHGAEAFNLGTGKGVSVLELLRAAEKAAGREIPREVCPARPGDVPEVYTSADKAARALGWKAELTVEQACADAWRRQSRE
ncbi:MAG: UDP-glucose 4-epimerase GalE [Oscillospiraceae bacterium]|nr:UDP-glucose 4-epimerase GalE [Oscillospiraceae bacterium]